MIDKKGSQIRIRIRSPKLFNSSTFRTKDVGKKGGLQLIVGRLKGKSTTTTQALRVNVKDFKIVKLKGHSPKLMPVSPRGMKEAKSILKLFPKKR